MTAHRLPRDLAFSDYHVRKDPGDTKTLHTDMSLVTYSLVGSASAETRVLATPKRAGVRITVVRSSGAGACTISTAGAEYIYIDGNPLDAVLLADVADTLDLVSIRVGTTVHWLGYKSQVGVSGGPAPATVADGDTDITMPNIRTGICVMVSSTGARAPKVPTGTEVNAALAVGESVDWSFINNGDQTVTITANTGHTLVPISMALTTMVSAQLRTRCTAANTAITYALASI